MTSSMTIRRLAGSLLGLFASFAIFAPVMAHETGNLDGDSLLVTMDNPFDPKYANAGQNLRTGVGSIFIEFNGIPEGGFICTASVIDDRHVLTAAHCVREAGDTVRRLRLILSAGLPEPLIIDATGFSVHPFYDITQPSYGAFAIGDIAVIEFSNPFPDSVERYGLYDTADEFFKTTRHYGHGRSGNGKTGATVGTDFFFGRTGLNMYEQTLEPLLQPGNPFLDQLLLDFDSGGEKHNAMDWWFSGFFCHPEKTNNPAQAQDGRCTTFNDKNYPDKGFKKNKLEIGIAPGDSGGPGFIDGKIAGVHSFGFTYFCGGAGSPANGTDFTCGLDSSFGEMSGDTRVSSYASWVGDQVATGTDSMIPESGAPALAAGATEELTDLSESGKAFLDVAVARTLRKAGTFEDALEQQGVNRQ